VMFFKILLDSVTLTQGAAAEGTCSGSATVAGGAPV
jgi:hypothetical protein